MTKTHKCKCYEISYALILNNSTLNFLLILSHVYTWKQTFEAGGERSQKMFSFYYFHFSLYLCFSLDFVCLSSLSKHFVSICVFVSQPRDKLEQIYLFAAADYKVVICFPVDKKNWSLITLSITLSFVGVKSNLWKIEKRIEKGLTSSKQMLQMKL